jgi:Protein of unknown function (DUF3309)
VVTKFPVAWFLPASCGILSPPERVLPCHLGVFASHCGKRKKQCEADDSSKRNAMNLILLIVLIVLLLGAAPTWPYSRNWGYYPSGGLGMVVVILLILMLMGRL